MDCSLVNKLMCCAKAVADGNLKHADVIFEEMEVLTTAETNEVTKKVVEYFAEALVRRVHGLHPRNPMPLLPSTEMLNYPYTQEIPLLLFATIATNYNMLQTLITERSKQIHFIDFSTVVSYRYWRDWFFYYGMRVHGSLSFRVTSIRPKLSRYDDHLQKCKFQQLITVLAPQIDFQCEEVFANSAAEIAEAVLNLKRASEDETIIVRWVFELHKLLSQEGTIEKVLSKLKDLRPDIMVIVEQEANHNSSDFFNRFSSSFDYYHRVFEASEQHDTDPRVKLLSEMHLRRQISNVVASEGIDRFERHETFDRWQERLSQAGFNSIPLWSNELKNRSLHPKSEFIIVENNGFPMLRFLNRPVAVVSVWKPVDPTQFNDVDRGNVGNSNSILLRGDDINYPITIQDTDHASPPFETEAASSSDSEDDIVCYPDMMTNRRIWFEDEVQKYLLSSLTKKETKAIVRWMDRKMTGTFTGHYKRLNVRDTSLTNLLRIPPTYIPIEEERQYYVDDLVINAFFKLLRKRSEKFPNLYIKNYSLPTCIMSFLLSGKWSETKALSCLVIEEIVGTLKLFIPVCLEDHWILIYVDIEKRAMLWLDSLNSPFDRYLTEKNKISEWIIKHLLPMLGDHNSQEWQFGALLDIPYQTNRVDCGIFVMKYADCLAHGDHFPFTQANMPHFRHRIFLDIYRGRLPVADSALHLQNPKRLFQDTNGTVWSPTEKQFEPEVVSTSESDEPEVVSSSGSDDDNAYASNTIRTMRIQKIWSPEEVREYLVSPFTERESKRSKRWKSRQLTGNFAGRDKKLNVRDTSLASLLRIPPSNIPISEEKQYYVDDVVINTFFDLLRKRQEKFPNLYKKIYSLPTWIMSFLLSGKWTETKVLSCLNIEEIAGTSKLFVPLCLENHWILICVHMEKQAVLWLDSLNSSLDAHYTEKTTISGWIINHLLPVLGYHNSQQWHFQQLVDIPYQRNGVDCGIFMMKYADCLAHCDHFPFTQQDMPHFRHRVFLDIYRARLPMPYLYFRSLWSDRLPYAKILYR